MPIGAAVFQLPFNLFQTYIILSVLIISGPFIVILSVLIISGPFIVMLSFNYFRAIYCNVECFYYFRAIYCNFECFNYTPRNEVVEGYTGFTMSIRL
jgi:hypothetical protein